MTEAARFSVATDKVPDLALSSLQLSCFRNYNHCNLGLVPAPVVLVGDNGAGKTNILEAVSLLAPGRGLRRARLQDIQQQGAPAPWAVAVQLVHQKNVQHIGTGLDPEAPASSRRVVRVDGLHQPGQTVLAELAPMVWLTPKQDRLFVEGASERRRFLDRLVYGFYTSHLKHLQDFEYAHKERARLLTANMHDRAWLQSLEERMAENGVAIAAARLNVVEMLNAHCRTRHSAFPASQLVCIGTLEQALTAGSAALTVEDEYRLRLQRARQSVESCDGPHRSDLQAWHLPKNTEAKYCSTGEQKALLLSLVLAQAELLKIRSGKTPLLLLDEVAAHLDAVRRDALFTEILTLKSQAWLTGTDINWFSGIGQDAQIVRVAAGVCHMHR